MKPVYGLLIALILIGGIVGLVMMNGDDSDENASEQTTTETTNDTSNAGVDANQSAEADQTEITANEVAEHSSETDCWTIIDGSVYDITSYISRHPGGAEILRACGTDGSSLFNSRTTEDGETVGSGTSHSSSAASQLEAFKVGTLAQ